MFKISHELPINMLDKSFEINDYEYCLPHLLDQNETYRRHFENAKESGSYIIMDNSLHELGEAYNSERLLHWINHLEPNEFIVPDVWQDQTATLVNAKRWMSIKLPKGVTKVAVVQAQNYHEAFQCYNILKVQGYKKIAFSYGADWYAEEFPHPNPLVGKMMGRIMTISKMYKSGLIEKTDRVHLLGCALPQEFAEGCCLTTGAGGTETAEGAGGVADTIAGSDKIGSGSSVFTFKSLISVPLKTING